MLNRKIKQLALAVGVALGGAGLLPSAQAVNVSPDNLGQALIFPYYTVRGDWNSLFHVTNTTDRWVAVRVRFREAFNSRDVNDFIVILSPEDWWGATVYNVLENGEENAAVGIFPDENSCLVGLQPRGESFPPPDSYRAPFEDGGPVTLDRLRSGYVEMIMMGATATRDIPYDCSELQTLFFGRLPPGQTANPQAALTELRTNVFTTYPDNALKGQFSLVNVNGGFNAASLPTALSNFRTAPLVTLHLPSDGVVTFPNSWHEPSLNSADNPGAYFVAGSNTPVTGGANGAAAVTFALQASALLNEWSRNPTGQTVGVDTFVTATDWVVTFPTKNFYVDTDTHQYAGQANDRTPAPPAFVANQPFAEEFNGFSCDQIDLTVYNREEGFLFPTPGPSPSGPVFALCKETNVLTFNRGEILQEADVVFVNFDLVNFFYGWMDLDFRTNLPPVGFAITTRDFGSTFRSEGAAYNHSIVRP